MIDPHTTSGSIIIYVLKNFINVSLKKSKSQSVKYKEIFILKNKTLKDFKKQKDKKTKEKNNKKTTKKFA